MARAAWATDRQRGLRPWLLALCLMLPAAAHALPSDREQPIYIEADSVEIDDTRGVSVYRGKVRYTQGTTELTADEATVYSKDRKLRKLVAKGRPAHYSTLPEGEKEKMTAEALTIVYLADKKVYEFHGQAHLWHEGNEFFGAFISYDAQHDLVNAHKGKQGEGRVRVIIMPEKKPEKKKEEPAPPVQE